MSTFQLIILSIFGLAIFIGLLVFSGSIPGFRESADGSLGTVTLWGTLPMTQVEVFLREFNEANAAVFKVIYVPKDPLTFEVELLDALASGQGPDLAIIPDSIIYREGNKFLPIPYETLSLRDFKDTFVEAGEVFLSPAGTLALPLTVDPLMMYYNRSLFSGAGIATPPATWTDFREQLRRINNIDNAGVIKTSLVAAGEFSNIVNAKPFLSLLFLQAGTPIVTLSADGEYRSALAVSTGGAMLPGQAALEFFTQFSNPSKTTYSWNRSLPEAKDAFAAGMLATYFGFGSEWPSIRAKNPNLNFDVTIPPQREGGRRLTFGRVEGVGILRASDNLPAAAAAAVALAGREGAGGWAAAAGRPPARRDLLAAPPGDDRQAAFYRGAVMAVSWVDPNAFATNAIFANAVERVTTGRETAYDSIVRASNELDNLFK